MGRNYGMGDKRKMTEEKIKAKAKEQFPNDEFAQQIIIDAINWATKELEKENAELKERVSEQSERISELTQELDNNINRFG